MHYHLGRAFCFRPRGAAVYWSPVCDDPGKPPQCASLHRCYYYYHSSSFLWESRSSRRRRNACVRARFRWRSDNVPEEIIKKKKKRQRTTVKARRSGVVSSTSSLRKIRNTAKNTYRTRMPHSRNGYRFENEPLESHEYELSSMTFTLKNRELIVFWNAFCTAACRRFRKTTIACRFSNV